MVNGVESYLLCSEVVVKFKFDSSVQFQGMILVSFRKVYTGKKTFTNITFVARTFFLPFLK